jgi:hypothetical protein
VAVQHIAWLRAARSERAAVREERTSSWRAATDMPMGRASLGASGAQRIWKMATCAEVSARTQHSQPQ